MGTEADLMTSLTQMGLLTLEPSIWYGALISHGAVWTALFILTIEGMRPVKRTAIMTGRTGRSLSSSHPKRAAGNPCFSASRFLSQTTWIVREER